MTNQHPITPPPKLVQQWYDSIPNNARNWQQQLVAQAAQWGADRELEACCEWLHDTCVEDPEDIVPELRAARRPKPPSLKEQALEWLIAAEELHKVSGIDPEGTIRRALEALDD
jgi:glutathionylspermidine synthase